MANRASRGGSAGIFKKLTATSVTAMSIVIMALAATAVKIIEAIGTNAAKSINAKPPAHNLGGSENRQTSADQDEHLSPPAKPPLDPGPKIALGLTLEGSPFFDDRWPAGTPLPVNVSSPSIVNSIKGSYKSSRVGDSRSVQFDLGASKVEGDGIDFSQCWPGCYVIDAAVKYQPSDDPTKRRTKEAEFAVNIAEMHTAAQVLSANGRDGLHPLRRDMSNPPEFLDLVAGQRYDYPCTYPLKRNWLVAYLLNKQEGSSFTLIGPFDIKATLDPKSGEITCRIGSSDLKVRVKSGQPKFTWQSLLAAPYASLFLTMEPDDEQGTYCLMVGISRQGHHVALGRFDMPHGWKTPVQNQPAIVGLIADTDMSFGGLEISTIYANIEPPEQAKSSEA